ECGDGAWWSAMSMRISRRSRQRSFRRRENAAPAESAGAERARARRIPIQSARVPPRRARSQREDGIVGKFGRRMTAASLAHLLHRLPERKNLTMLMRDREAALLPREHLDKA